MSATKIQGNTAKDASGSTYYLLCDSDGYLLLKPGTTGAGTAAAASRVTLASDDPLNAKFAAAAALSDALSNPTATQLGANLLAWDGSQWVRLRTVSTRKDLSTVTISSITTVWTPTTGKKFRLMGGTVSVSAAGSILFEDNTGGNTVFRTPSLAANIPYTFDIPGGVLSAAANNVLKATLSVSGTVIGTIWGTEE